MPNDVRFAEDDLQPISKLADVCFCERRAALHLLERVWEDNIFTVEGTHLHRKVDKGNPMERRGRIRIARSLRLRSLRLGLVGKADVVEFHRLQESVNSSFNKRGASEGVVLEGVKGPWRPFPVEYKAGKLRHEKGYEVQLCAQAMCLEEMLNCVVPEGALFYGKTRQRLDIPFNKGLRSETKAATVRLHEIVRSGKTPRARYENKCKKCSLLQLCMPKVTGAQRDVRSYLKKAISETEMETK